MFLNALSNFYLTTQAKPWKLQKPVVIQFPVNDVCNSRCQMCNIWQQKFDHQISPLELNKALSNSLFTEVKGVGINGGEPTLRKDLPDLVNVLFEALPKLSTISLITNSLISDQVIQQIAQVGEVIQKHKGNFDVMVSLDGVRDVHDKVRGRKGNFENAVKVIDFINSSDLVSNRRLGCTVIKDNLYGLHELLEFAISKNVYIKYRLGIPHQRLYSNDVKDPFNLSFEEKYHLSIFLENLIQNYEKSVTQKHFYKSLVDQIIYQKPRAAGCDWQHKGATLSSRGELLYCAVESKVLGSAISESSHKIYFENSHHLSEIVKSKCDSCTHDYVGIPPSRVLLNDYLRKFLKKTNISLFQLKKLPLLVFVRKYHRMISYNARLSLYKVDLRQQKSIYPSTRFPKTSSLRKKVLICGWYGTETLGDKAILGGVVSALQDSIVNIDISLVSIEPYISEMTALQMPELKISNILSVEEGVQVASSMDLVVFGGGPLMGIPSLAEMIAIFQKAVDSKVPTLIAGCGVGPLGDSFYKRSIKYLLLQASCRIFRDEKSRQVAQSLGVNTSMDLVAEDPAATWLRKQIPKLECLPDTSTNMANSKMLILGLRDWPYREYAADLSTESAKILKEKFEKTILYALEELVRAYPDLIILPFPMCTNHIGGDDRWFYRKLFRDNCNLRNSLDLSCLDAEIDPAEAVKLFKSASAALTMRFHSLVFALSSELPAVAIDYTLGKGKVKSLAEKHGVPFMSLDSINSDFIVKHISRILSEDNKPDQIRLDSSDLKFSSAVRGFIKDLE